jgi:hypothetical protein
MRKEVIFAILIGLILGFVILYGIQLANQSAQNAADSSITPTQSASPSVTPTPTSSTKLTITQPDNHAVVNTTSITITGKTIPGSDITILSSEDDTLTTADDSGNFSADFKLAGGENIIKITALSPDKNLEETSLTIIYTTAIIPND